MLNNWSKRHRRFILVLAFIAMALLSGHAYGQSTLLNHPVFTKYPSPAELQQDIDKFRREHPDEFSAARLDFDTAIRFLHNQPPPTDRDFIAAHGKVPHKIHKWRLYIPNSRDWLWNHQSEREKKTGITPRMRFVRRNIEVLTVDFSPVLRMVALDVVLNGWDDWSAWSTYRLKGYRQRYPDIYRITALSLLIGMNHENRLRASRDATVDVNPRETGLLLRMLMQTDGSYELQRRVILHVTRIHADLDALDFVVKLALEGKSETVRRNGLSCMGSLTESLPIDQQRDFWVQYLDSNDSSIRSYAVSRVGITIDLLKKDLKEKAINDQLAERLRRIAADDTDSWIRLKANRAVTTYEDDSPPRGLIDYGKDNKAD